MSGDQDYRDLVRLLALKRHEQPPPGYFDRLPREITARLRAHIAREEEPGWLQRFWAIFETKPIAAGAFGAAVCGMLFGGLLFTEQAGGNMSEIPQPELTSGFHTAAVQPYPSSLSPTASIEPFARLLGTNTAPGSETAPSLFNDLQRARTYNVDFSLRAQ